MKKFLTVMVSFIIPCWLWAQAPEKIPYQAVVRDQDNNVVGDRVIGMRIQIKGGSETGPTVYAETQTPTTGKNGLVYIEIGNGTAESGSFGAIKWAMGPYYVKTEIDPAGGTSYSILGTSGLLSVPYAFYTKTASKVGAPFFEAQGLSDVIAINDSANGPIKNVTDPTDAQDVATSNYFMEIFLNSGYISANNSTPVMDGEGNLYRTVLIGELKWMSENLRSTKYNDGTDIALVTDNAAWAGLATPAYCWYGNIASSSYEAKICGALYNWYVVNTDKLCPREWRVPTEDEWNDLITAMGGEAVAGGKLKEAGTKHWAIPNVQATNESGLKALPGGYRDFDGFKAIGIAGFWWSSSEVSADDSGSLGLINNLGTSSWLGISKKVGMSVRCVREEDHIILSP
jgi:uncharacterized protein (TIGR02145 family)